MILNFIILLLMCVFVYAVFSGIDTISYGGNYKADEIKYPELNEFPEEKRKYIIDLLSSIHYSNCGCLSMCVYEDWSERLDKLDEREREYIYHVAGLY